MSHRPLVPATPLGHVSQDSPLPSSALFLLRKPKYRRVKTGCRTCRARKIKCDETRPACTRCLAAGRDCPGYPKKDKRDDVIVIKNPVQGYKTPAPSIRIKPSDVPIIGHDPHDIRLFEVFQLSAIRTIPGHTPMRTWMILIPQLCLNEPVVAHAALAIASLHEEVELNRQPMTDLSSTSKKLPGPQAYALKHYGKALQELRRHLQNRNASPVIVLVACIVFTAFEALRGQSQAAIAHIQSGNKILQALKAPHRDGLPARLVKCMGLQPILSADIVPDEGGTDHGAPPNLSGPEMSLVSTSFSKLTTLIGSSEEQSMKVPSEAQIQATGPISIQECPSEFKTLDEARGVLFLLMNSARQVIYACMQMAHKGTLPGPDDGVPRCVFLDTQLRRWSSTLDKLLSQNASESSKDPSVPPESSEIVLMRLWCKFISVRLWACILPSRASLNALTPDFEELMDLCERCLNLQGEGYAARLGKRDRRTPVFIMDMGVLPVLFFTGRKCTDISLRWRAVRLLDRAPRREALWDAETVKRTVTQILTDEEKASAELEDGRMPDLYGLTAGDHEERSKNNAAHSALEGDFPQWQDFFYSPSHRKNTPVGHAQSYQKASLSPDPQLDNESHRWSDWLSITPNQLESLPDSLYNLQVSGAIPSQWDHTAKPLFTSEKSQYG